MQKSWNIIQSLLTEPLSHVQTDSYKGCIENTIPRVLRQFNPIYLKYKLQAGQPDDEDVTVKIYVGAVFDEEKQTILDNGEGIFFGQPTILRKLADGTTRVSPLFPNEARLRDMTYETELSANVILQIIDPKSELSNIIRFDSSSPTGPIKVGNIPIMVRSTLCNLNKISNDPKITGECPQDQGGYYIIDGNEKVVIGQERQVENRPYSRKYRDGPIQVSCECRSVPEQKFQPPRTTSVRFVKRHAFNETQQYIEVLAPGMKQAIPLTILMRILGVATEAKLFDMVAVHINPSLHPKLLEFIRHSYLYSRTMKYTSLNYQETIMEAWSKIHGVSDSETLSNARLYDVMKVIKENILPHLGYEMMPKALFIGSMIADMFLVMEGLDTPTDKDSYLNKRIDMGGYLLGKLFRDLYFRVQKKIQESMNIHIATHKDSIEAVRFLRESFITKHMIDRTILDEGFRYAFKNCWGMKNAPCVVGISQELSRYSYPSYLSHIRRINTPLPATAALREPHALHASTWGFACPVETPDGRNVGIRKNFAVAARITVGLPTPPIESLCYTLGVTPVGQCIPEIHSTKTNSLGYPIFINERLIGYVWEANKFIQTFRTLRRSGIIHPYVSIYNKSNIYKSAIIISCDDGRPIRPLYVVKDNKVVQDYPTQKESIAFLATGRRDITDAEYFSIDTVVDINALNQWKTNPESFSQGIIEWLDPQEQDNSLIAMSEEDLHMKDQVVRNFTHMEIHPSLIMGVLGLNIPFTQTNQSPRNVYSSAQGKQAVGIYATNFMNRMDNKVMVLAYPQKPIVTTHYAPFIRNEIMPHGINAIVAIMSYSGYNQEDAVIINKSAVERGLFNSVTFRALGTKEDLGDQETIGIVPESDMVSPKKARRNLLDSRGIVKVGEIIDEDDVLVMKTAPSNFRDADRRKQLRSDVSLQTKRHESGIVDSVFVDTERSDGTLVKIRLRKPKLPELGDKFSSRHGQKGTIGMLLSEEDMPMNADGIRPDILVNPHAIPSRMTIGQLVEVILGKRGAMRGEQYAATAFENGDPRTISNLLLKSGMESYANEVLYNGRTGEQMRVNIFMGPTFYQRLMHQVADKVNVRTTGPKSALTRQPVGGRGAGGGLRIGEMERDALISHGVASFLKESLMERADKSHIWIGTKSGMISACNPRGNLYHDFITEDFSRTRARDKTGMLMRGDDRIVISNPRSEFCRISVPHAFTLFLQELEAQGFKIQLITDIVLKVWQKVDPELITQYDEIVGKYLKLSSTKRSISNISWFKELIRHAKNVFSYKNASIQVAFSEQYIPQISKMQAILDSMNDNTTTFKRLDIFKDSNQLNVICISPESDLASLISPSTGSSECVLVSASPLSTEQQNHLQQMGWISYPKQLLSISGIELWRKSYQLEPKPVHLLINNVGNFSSKMEPFYPSILSSNPISGNIHSVIRRLTNHFNEKKLAIQSVIGPLFKYNRSYFKTPKSSLLLYSNEHSEQILSDISEESMDEMVKQTISTYKNYYKLFDLYTKPSYTEVVDNEHSLYRWVFPMNRFQDNEYKAYQTLIHTHLFQKNKSFVLLPERTCANEKGSIYASRALRSHTLTKQVIPGVNDLQSTYTIHESEMIPLKERYTSIQYMGEYPLHLKKLSDEFSYFWTKPTDCIKTTEHDDYILPDYKKGMIVTSQEQVDNIASYAKTTIISHPEELLGALHWNTSITYQSPYCGWLNNGILDISYIKWSADGTMEKVGSGAPIFIELDNNITEYSDYIKWINSNTDLLIEIRNNAHSWIREMDIPSLIKEYISKLPTMEDSDKTEYTLDTFSHDISLDIPIKPEDAIATMIGSKGINMKRFQITTGLTMTIQKDVLHIAGKYSAKFTQDELNSQIINYLSYRDIKIPITQSLLATMGEDDDVKTIARKLAQKERSFGIIPLKLGNGIKRSIIKGDVSQLALKGQQNDINTYLSIMGINVATSGKSAKDEGVDLMSITQMELYGNKPFMIIIPVYPNVEGSGVDFYEVAKHNANRIHSMLLQVAQKFSFTGKWNIILLHQSSSLPSNYPIGNSDLVNDDGLIKWNEACANDAVSLLSKYSPFSDSKYAIWIPPNWSPISRGTDSNPDLKQLDVVGRFFMTPESKDSPLLAFKSDDVQKPYYVDMTGPALSSPPKVMDSEESKEWENTLIREWNEKEYMNSNMVSLKNPIKYLVNVSDKNYHKLYINNCETIDNGIYNIKYTPLLQLLETTQWKKVEDDWKKTIERYAGPLTEHINATELSGGRVEIKIDPTIIHYEYTLLILAALTKGNSYKVDSMDHSTNTYIISPSEVESVIQYSTKDVSFDLENGLSLPEYVIESALSDLMEAEITMKITGDIRGECVDKDGSIIQFFIDHGRTTLVFNDTIQHPIKQLEDKYGNVVMYALLLVSTADEDTQEVSKVESEEEVQVETEEEPAVKRTDQTFVSQFIDM